MGVKNAVWEWDPQSRIISACVLALFVIAADKGWDLFIFMKQTFIKCLFTHWKMLGVIKMKAWLQSQAGCDYRVSVALFLRTRVLISSIRLLCTWKEGVTHWPQEHCSPAQLNDPSRALHLGHSSCEEIKQSKKSNYHQWQYPRVHKNGRLE